MKKSNPIIFLVCFVTIILGAIVAISLWALSGPKQPTETIEPVGEFSTLYFSEENGDPAHIWLNLPEGEYYIHIKAYCRADASLEVYYNDGNWKDDFLVMSMSNRQSCDYVYKIGSKSKGISNGYINLIEWGSDWELAIVEVGKPSPIT